MAIMSATTPAKLSSGAAAAILTAGLLAAGVAAAAPAEAACYGYVDAGYNYSYAEGYVDTCASYNYVRSYAQHGNVAALSAWYTGSSWAFADAGVSTSYSAWNQWS
ncbi:hypothetical protein DEF23_06630 [Marinitenerispora sediminis]|uniref:Lactococcin 972 family bacteriocin n=2 Tax=Marinitenerispora sediminis TaxID=1931232 RepID=A0A368T2T3_9ACTN|nr:hypothetical protein DEF24_17820 [Marinitenerispora sediminis]RCV57605.1 hypothetical protein DEF28_01430 [Marinitenerispora sediminis]RCV59648.1 hypothetical protein DEF23_06630 [Marinitenerispora sediminis]